MHVTYMYIHVIIMCIYMYNIMYMYICRVLQPCPGSILEGPEPESMKEFVHSVSCL